MGFKEYLEEKLNEKELNEGIPIIGNMLKNFAIKFMLALMNNPKVEDIAIANSFVKALDKEQFQFIKENGFRAFAEKFYPDQIKNHKRMESIIKLVDDGILIQSLPRV